MARAFSEDLKWRIIYLHHDGYSRIKIARLLHISKRTVDNILQIYVQWGTVINLWQKPPGRHKTLTQNEMKILRELIKDKVDWYLDELVGELEQQTGKLLHQVAYERNELLRSTFIAKVGRDYKPEQLIFMDEASKDERTLSRGYGYSLKNTFAIKKNVFVCGVRYTILPAFSLQGIIAELL
ncbi:Homeodomain-like protein [Rhizophagus irregularis DAOM 181602=DAOM 197198]|uniref:Homeodomain-like protein n=1 Tax=Rhizophagus irregularis (strain DAOM 181602 / DAOM 197198 / MUCL 43194) TaxID=747089 RepID=A0A2P4NZX2_RHIID|nr:Homeodomain-like protein [Rhizophagus irregularis DAOM 181602=DAOM 197198]POG58682.1 Homeodomain-like protein [Rhizophagus irregularis DAOM 181602=DAOM 197198]|eukprot:XP_025165548.1 Homeodomain-like protein [Rhizophagus irregularis DAOM 181602=DAOM 197198]